MSIISDKMFALATVFSDKPASHARPACTVSKHPHIGSHSLQIWRQFPLRIYNGLLMACSATKLITG